MEREKRFSLPGYFYADLPFKLRVCLILKTSVSGLPKVTRAAEISNDKCMLSVLGSFL